MNFENQLCGRISCPEGQTLDQTTCACITPSSDTTPDDGVSWDYKYIAPDKPWLDDPSTGGDTPDYEQNEFAKYVFEELFGGTEDTGYETGEEWWAEFGEDFPSWEESTYYQQYISILEQMGIQDEQEGLRGEEYAIDKTGLALKGLSKTAENVLGREKLQYGAESQFIAAGGGVSGRGMRTTEAASEALSTALTLDMTGIDMDRSLLDIAYDDDLYDIESQRLDYQDDLRGETDKYEETLIGLTEWGGEGRNPYTKVSCEGTCEAEGMDCVNGWCQPALSASEKFLGECECGGVYTTPTGEEGSGECFPCDADGNRIPPQDPSDPEWQRAIADCTGWGEGTDETCWEQIKDLPQDIIDGMGLGDEYDRLKKFTDMMGEDIQIGWDNMVQGMQITWDNFEDWYQSGESAEEWEHVKTACAGIGSDSFQYNTCMGELEQMPEALRNDALDALGLDDEFAEVKKLWDTGKDWYQSGAVHENWEEVKDSCAGMGTPDFDTEACWGKIAELPHSALESLGLDDEWEKLKEVHQAGHDLAKGKLNEAGEWIVGTWDTYGNLLNEAGNIIWDAGTNVWAATEDLLPEAIELAEQGLDALCVSASAGPCATYALGKAAVEEAKFWSSKGDKGYSWHFNDCLDTTCG